MTDTDVTKAFPSNDEAPRIGDRFELLAETVTTTQLVRYAGASDDYNRIHYDAPFAVEAGLGGIIAHGMLTMGFMARCANALAGATGFVSHLDARFSAPVRPGDTVRVVARVTRITSVPAIASVTPATPDRRAAPKGGGAPRFTLDCDLEADVDGRAVAAGHASIMRGMWTMPGDARRME